jgi:hypothetical protein
MPRRSFFLMAICLALLLGTSVPAEARLNCGDTHRFGQVLVRVGDSERRALEARRPDREVQLETRRGGAAGYRLDFYERHSTVQIHVQAGVVTRICRARR